MFAVFADAWPGPIIFFVGGGLLCAAVFAAIAAVLLGVYLARRMRGKSPPEE